uniref:Uncharacterized protein n=1 Tax=Chromera velia CCMP2878 TaxID=1169474 RepID=A0A0G4HFP7_9ALVE|eukprot:Cvel_26982.t1-p1 / transcript=Cvel_26982.t1 / gene=Cvel_26982 / organism=Chromera_velia_CCMP2878 / gene_product=hypothetical protein / transcript_product=hypothetical protein / location=Cvel_scaffold3294:14115-14420(+) / protein_length=102 / sequence_SO=supercontig / SO=protein_coding / is_pseudo=false
MDFLGPRDVYSAVCRARVIENKLMAVVEVSRIGNRPKLGLFKDNQGFVDTTKFEIPDTEKKYCNQDLSTLLDYSREVKKEKPSGLATHLRRVQRQYQESLMK